MPRDLTPALPPGFRLGDPFWDGRTLVASAPERFCLPSCRAGRIESPLRLVPDLDSAQAAGLTPCPRCKPVALWAGAAQGEATVAALLDRLRADPSAVEDHELERHAEAIARHLQATPAELARRWRARAAVRELAAGGDDDAAAAAGGFVDRLSLDVTVRDETGLDPEGWRRLRCTGRVAPHMPPGFSFAAPLAYHGRRGGSPAERLTSTGGLVKAAWLPSGPGRIALEPVSGGGLEVTVMSGAGGAPAPEDAPAALAIVRRLLGLVLAPEPFEARAAREPEVARLIGDRAGLRVPMTADLWESLVWAILGQQVTVLFAADLRGALIARYGTPAGDGMVAHPRPADLAAAELAELRALRLSTNKAKALTGLGAAALGAIALDALPDGLATTARRQLLALPGIGPWTADYALLRGCGFPDCVPVGDAGLVESLRRFHGAAERPGPAETLALMAPFAPHRSLATCHFWARPREAAP